MAQRPKAAAPLPSSSVRAARVGFAARLRSLGLLLREPYLPLLILGTLLVALLAYQPRFQLATSLTRQPTDVRLFGTFPAEGQGDAAQRWTTERATLVFVGVGQGSYSVLLRFHGGAQAGAGRTLTVSAGDTTLASLPVRSDWQELAVLVPPSAVDAASGDLALTLAVPAMRGATDDPRSLGVALSHVSINPAGAAGVALPPWRRAAQLLLIVLLAFIAQRLVRVPALVAALAAGLLGIAWGLALATARLDAVLLFDIAQRVLPWTVAIGALFWLFARFVPRFAQPPAAVACATLLIFALRFGGQLHPQYIMIDQKLRANQLALIAAGRTDLVRPQLEQQYEWGTREPVPYSLITYDMLVPLTWFWKDDDLVKAIAATGALLDASMPLLLWALLRRTGARRETGDPVAADSVRRSDQSPIPDSHSLAPSFAALCYATLPVGYLFFHDGSFPTTIGLWFVMLALVSLRWLLDTRHEADILHFAFSILHFAFPVVLLGLALTAYVTHLAFVPFLVGALAASLWIVGKDHWGAQRVALALALAIFGGWLIYYRDYTLTLIQRTIPAFVQQIAEQGSVGRDTDLLYATAVNTPLEHLQAHFRVWPVIFAVVALALLLLNQRRRFVTHLGLAYGLFLAATVIAEQWFGLWNKHMAFAAPGIALLSGVGLGFMWRRGPVARLICIVLIVFLFWESTVAWGNRVLWYLLPADAL